MQRESNQQLWSARVQEQSASGLGIRAWCVREGLTESTFHYWRKRLAAAQRPATTLIALPSVGLQAAPVVEVMTRNGLALVVAETLGHDPVGAHWFVFCNRGRDRLKILHWDTNGFWLHCRRLEQGRFHWPKDAGDQQSLAVTARQLRWLIDGLNWQNAVAHQPFERRAML